ncbi:hypothetical protein [Aquibacillus kalidii]|uniref:hypothetical protein n=1 Tax=Aquibacillus kalidii TaxID=2762597 RepID=UPI0016455D18|nr:hypothetical protein [Aquibacillus kalidii]
MISRWDRGSGPSSHNTFEKWDKGPDPLSHLRSDFTIKEEELTMFGTKKLSYNLIKKVGHEDVVIGEAQINKRLFSSFSSINYSHPGQQQLSELSFSLPEDPRSGKN